MALPNHKYLTLPQAAKVAGCEVNDLIHFAAIGLLQFCIKIPEYGFSIYEESDEGEEEELTHPGIAPVSSYDFSEYLKNRTEEDKENDEDPNSIHRLAGSYSSDYIRVIEFCDVNGAKNIVHKLDGFLGIKQRDIYEWEEEIISGEIESIAVFEFDLPRCQESKTSQNYKVSGFEAHDFTSVNIKLSDLKVTSEEFELLLNGGRLLDQSVGVNGYYIDDTEINQVKDVCKVNVNKIGDFIEALIRSVPELGDRVMNTSINNRYNLINAFFEEKHKQGKLVDINPPSSATLEKYFKI